MRRIYVRMVRAVIIIGEWHHWGMPHRLWWARPTPPTMQLCKRRIRCRRSRLSGDWRTFMRRQRVCRLLFFWVGRTISRRPRHRRRKGAPSSSSSSISVRALCQASTAAISGTPTSISGRAQVSIQSSIGLSSNGGPSMIEWGGDG